MITGPKEVTGVKRRRASINHIAPLKEKIGIKRGSSDEDVAQIKLQVIARDEAKKKISTQVERRKFLYAVINDIEIKQLIKENRMAKAKSQMMKILREWK